MKITLIVGLPGSGKTHYARSIANGRKIVDDPVTIGEIFGITEDFIVCDPYLCCGDKVWIENELRDFYPEVILEWIYFENNPKQCLINASTRLDKKVDNFILFLSSKYVIPDYANVLPVWK